MTKSLLKSIELIGVRVLRFVPGFYGIARRVQGLVDSMVLRNSTGKGQPLFIVYQQGRVASTSAYEAIARSNLNMPVFHLHTLSSDRADILAEKSISAGQPVQRNVVLGRKIGQKFSQLSAPENPDNRWKFLSICRDPLAIMLSLKMMHAQGGEQPSSQFEQIMTTMRDALEKDDPRGWEISNWFDQVLTPETGIDPYSVEFDHERGFSILETDKARLAVVKFESLKTAFQPAVSELLGRPLDNLEMRNENLHRDRSMDGLSKYMKENLKFSRAFCETAYSSKFMQHFYSDAEREALIRRWTQVGS